MLTDVSLMPLTFAHGNHDVYDFLYWKLRGNAQKGNLPLGSPLTSTLLHKNQKCIKEQYPIAFSHRNRNGFSCSAY